MLLSIKNSALVFEYDVEKFLEIEKKKKFNIFFFDPPFSDKSFIKNLNFIKENKMYEKNHLVIIHRERKTEENLGDHMNIIMTKQYGRSKIIFGIFTK